MSFVYEEKTSLSPFVETVWRASQHTDGVYVASADACWDMIFVRPLKGKPQVLLSGPGTETANVSYQAGNISFGVQFRHGTVFKHIPVAEMVNVTKQLPMPTDDTFVLCDITWKFPTYEHIDLFLSGLSEHGLLTTNTVVRDVLENKTVNMSLRSIQRHFAVAVGLSPRQVKQIISSRKAVRLLLQGVPIAEVAYQLNYADQAHMTRMLKRYTGYTPLANKVRNEQV
jgi:hypothetical protein